MFGELDPLDWEKSPSIQQLSVRLEGVDCVIIITSLLAVDLHTSTKIFVELNLEMRMVDKHASSDLT